MSDLIKDNHPLKQGQVLTNGMKITSVITVLVCNLLYFIFHGKIMGMDEQKSLILAVGFCVTLFLPIDASLLAQNIFK